MAVVNSKTTFWGYRRENGGVERARSDRAKGPTQQRERAVVEAVVRHADDERAPRLEIVGDLGKQRARVSGDEMQDAVAHDEIDR